MSEDLPSNGSNPEKKDDLHTSQTQVQQDSTPDCEALLKESPSVKRIELLTPHIYLIDRVFLFFGIFLVAYVYGLDNQVRVTYQVRELFLLSEDHDLPTDSIVADSGDSQF